MGIMTLLGVGRKVTAAAPVSNPTGFSPTATYSSGDRQGYSFVPNSSTTVVSVTKDASVAHTTAYILDASYVQLASAAFSGNVATFGTPVSVTSGTTYHVIVDAGGFGVSRTTAYQDVSPSWPVVNTGINYTANTYYNGSWTNTTGGSPLGYITTVTTQ